MNLESKVKVLVVEDQTGQRLLLSRIVKKFSSIQLFPVADAFDAYAVLAENPDVDVIILDHEMPYVSGLEFMNKLRDSSAYKNVKIIFATADSEYESFCSVGADACLHKPFSADALQSALQDVLGVESLS